MEAIFAALRGELKESRRHRTKDVKAAVNRVAVPVLRELGFDGSFWRFRRSREGQVDLLTFGFPKGMGVFFIHIGKFPLDGRETHGNLIPAAKVEMKHLADEDKSTESFEGQEKDRKRGHSTFP